MSLSVLFSKSLRCGNNLASFEESTNSARSCHIEEKAAWPSISLQSRAIHAMLARNTSILVDMLFKHLHC